MGRKFLRFLQAGVRNVALAIRNFWKRHTTPPGKAERCDTYVDQW